MDDLFLKRVAALAAAGHARELDFDGVVARVAVDRFNAIEAPDAAAIERFSALACDALIKTDAGAATRIAALLAPNPSAPESVLAAVIAKGEAAAETVMRLAPRLSPALLLSRAGVADAIEAEAIARRPDISGAVVAELARRQEAEVLRALVANSQAHIDRSALLVLAQRGRRDAALARALLARGDLGAQALPLFLFADAPTRRRLMVEAERQSIGAPGAQTPPLARASALGAAHAGDGRGFAAIIARGFHVGRAEIDRMVDDDGCEALAILFPALGMQPQAGLHALLSLRPDLVETSQERRGNLELARLSGVQVD